MGRMGRMGGIDDVEHRVVRGLKEDYAGAIGEDVGQVLRLIGQ
jgi:hypothetical protein